MKNNGYVLLMGLMLLLGFFCDCSSGEYAFNASQRNAIIFDKPPPENITQVPFEDRLEQIMKGDRKGWNRRVVEIGLPACPLTYVTTFPPDIIKSTSDKRDDDTDFVGNSVHSFFEVFLKGPVSKDNKIEKKGIFISPDYKLYSCGTAGMDNENIIFMSWRDKTHESNATLAMKTIRLAETEWAAFVLEANSKCAEKAPSEVIFFCYPPFMGWVKGHRAFATADGDHDDCFSGGMTNALYWVLCHNNIARETGGMIYLFHPDDFIKVDVNGPYRVSIRAEIRPGKNKLRMAVAKFSGRHWKEVLQSVKKEAPLVLNLLSEFKFDKKYFPAEDEVLQADRLAGLRNKTVDIGSFNREVDDKKLQEYFSWFDKYKKQGLGMMDLVEYFTVKNSVKKEENAMADLYLRR